MAEVEPVVYNTGKWIAENGKYFLPPVCNKMMHNEGQLKVFYVGGPNQRKDYHIEEGEELFYMLKGDMCLKILEKGKHRDIPIREGEIFLLPARIPHSPQRATDTIGLVIERERLLDEKDGLRYFVEKDGVPTTDSLYERWFYCKDLGSQLAPIIKEFFASEQYKTGRPLPGTIPENPPVEIDSKQTVRSPFNLTDWLNTNRVQLNKNGSILLFGEGYQFHISVYGQGENFGGPTSYETFLWQLEGTSSVKVTGKEYHISTGDTMLIQTGKKYSAKRDLGSVTLFCYQDPSLKY